MSHIYHPCSRIIKLIFGLQVHFRRIRVIFIYEGHLVKVKVKVKVTGTKKLFVCGLPMIEMKGYLVFLFLVSGLASSN